MLLSIEILLHNADSFPAFLIFLSIFDLDEISEVWQKTITVIILK